MKTAPLGSLLPARPEALARGAPPLLFLVLLLFVASVRTGHADEGSSLPEGATPHEGLPPLLPYEPRDKAAVRALCERLVGLGRAHAGSRLGGDYLFSAAYAQYHFLDAPKTARALYAEALDAYPGGDPTRGAVLLEQATYELPRGNHPRAKALLEQLTTWSRARSPANLSEFDDQRWSWMRQALARHLPALQAEMAESEGHFADAAKVIETLLTAGEVYLSPAELALGWERVARWRQRAGNAEGAQQAIEEALENTVDERLRADLAFWALYARHGLLAPDGGPAVSHAWPGESFERDLHVFLRTVQGVEGTGTTYLALASSAFRAGRKEIALEIYLLALRAPDLVEAARGDASLWRGLLMGFVAALDLERFEQAEQILAIVERIADEPIKEMDEYRIAIREARAAKREREAQAKKRPPPSPSTGPTPATPTRRPLGGIETASRSKGPDEDALYEEALADEDDSSPDWLWLASATLLAIALVLLLARRRQT